MAPKDKAHKENLDIMRSHLNYTKVVLWEMLSDSIFKDIVAVEAVVKAYKHVQATLNLIDTHLSRLPLPHLEDT